MSENFFDLTKNFLSATSRFLRSPTVKLGLICFLLLILAIPLLTVLFVGGDRERHANNARTSVASTWGGAQTVRGPYLIVPTIKRREIKIKTQDDKEETKTEITRKIAVFLPESLDVKTNIKSETRHRGIFNVPVYQSSQDITGHFTRPDTAAIEGEIDELIWKDAILVLMVSDVTSIKENISLSMNNGANTPRFRAGLPHALEHVRGIHARIGEQNAREGFEFSFNLKLNGSSNLNFVPSGGETKNTMISDWPHPSFQGAFLPNTREISEKGFTAQWSIPRLARTIPQVFLATNVSHFMHSNKFGVSLYQTSGIYSLLERSLKYALGFMAVAFFAVFIMEMRSGRQVHLVQYLFVGLAQIIFYLTLLGISEHTSFETAYALSSAATILLISIYVGAALGSVSQGIVLAGLLALLYGLLYMLLKVEDYAMLIGSISAFIMLTITMFFTRKVKWSGGNSARSEEKTV